jgi:hypothetical protein
MCIFLRAGEFSVGVEIVNNIKCRLSIRRLVIETENIENAKIVTINLLKSVNSTFHMQLNVSGRNKDKVWVNFKPNYCPKMY